MNKKKDLVIIGGGITGLYTLYKIIKSKKDLHISLYEKNDYFGGRIYTYFYKKFKFEAGAARFCKEKHLLFYKLLIELFTKNELQSYLTLGSADIKFIPKSQNYESKLIQKSPYYFINQIIKKSKVFSYHTLIKYTFIQFIKKFKLLKNNEIRYLRDSFGYSGEINDMNAFNALHMFKTDLNKKYHYYSLSCGLSEVIKRMISYIVKNTRDSKIEILNGCEVKNIIKNTDNNHYTCNVYDVKKKRIYDVETKSVVCAIQKSALLKYPIFKPIKKELNSVEAKALCRIYMIFDKKDIWFKDYGKITSNTHNRYMIPLDKKRGSIMISYTDSNYANHINHYYEKYGLKKLENYILSSWEQVLNIKIPAPKFTKVCYWKEGIAMWKAKVDSKKVSKKILKPCKNVFIVGENYSLNQAWMEGGLQTVQKIIKNLV